MPCRSVIPERSHLRALSGELIRVAGPSHGAMGPCAGHGVPAFAMMTHEADEVYSLLHIVSTYC